MRFRNPPHPPAWRSPRRRLGVGVAAALATLACSAETARADVLAQTVSSVEATVSGTSAQGSAPGVAESVPAAVGTTAETVDRAVATARSVATATVSEATGSAATVTAAVDTAVTGAASGDVDAVAASAPRVAVAVGGAIESTATEARRGIERLAERADRAVDEAPGRVVEKHSRGGSEDGREDRSQAGPDAASKRSAALAADAPDVRAPVVARAGRAQQETGPALVRAAAHGAGPDRSRHAAQQVFALLRTVCDGCRGGAPTHPGFTLEQSAGERRSGSREAALDVPVEPATPSHGGGGAGADAGAPGGGAAPAASVAHALAGPSHAYASLLPPIDIPRSVALISLLERPG